MGIQIIKRQNPLNSLAEGFMQGRKMRRENEDATLANAYKLAQIEELNRKSQALGQQAPAGYVRDPYSGDLKEDLSFTPPIFGQSVPGGLKVNEYDRYGRPKSYISGEKLTAGQELAKDKATKEIFENYEMDQARRKNLDNAMTGSETIPQGWMGKQKIALAKKFPSTKKFLGVSDANISDAQELKIALTMGTLAETAYTKGAISDQEMNLFKEAAANDDYNSPAIQPVLSKIRNFVDAGETGRFGAYQKNYGEDPRAWFGGLPKRTEFNSPEEADASGLPPGSVVKVKGRRYEI